MARRVFHYRNPNNESQTYCGREATYRYRFMNDAEHVTCTRCRSRMIRDGLLQATPVDEARASTARSGSSDSSFDNAWMQRVGILTYD